MNPRTHTPEEMKAMLRQFIENRCRGRENSMKLNALARQFLTDRKAVQAAIQGLIADGVPVGTSKTPPAGVFLIESEAERLAAANMLIRTAVSELKRAAALKKIPLGDVFRQLELGFVPQMGTGRP
ncbi:MAG: hypothetical protein KIT79_12745 [Deltaproteobacteria bacterium]|nr:hypothetical protein [Deltaproteobacteria bacterium]